MGEEFLGRFEWKNDEGYLKEKTGDGKKKISNWNERESNFFLIKTLRFEKSFSFRFRTIFSKERESKREKNN